MPENTQESSKTTLAVQLATAFGIGYGPIAPGTWGSAATLPLFAVLVLFPPWLYAASVLALLLLGIWAADEAERVFGTEDDSRIVIDEVVGQLLTLAPLLLARGRSLGLLHWCVLAVTGFVVFRVLDIWKPAPVRWAEQRFRGGAGVMLDDVVAGALGALVMVAVIVGALWA